jgi:hypothetical protein
MNVKQLFDFLAPNCPIRVRALRILGSSAGWLGAIEYLQIYSGWDLEPLKQLKIVNADQEVGSINLVQNSTK